MPQIQLIDQINDLSLYAARAVADENGKNLDSTYAKKSEVPAPQVNADWNASSGVAQILNKPSVYDQSTINSMMAAKQGTLYETEDISLGPDGVYPTVNLRLTLSHGDNVSGLKHNYEAPAYAENVAHVGEGPNGATYVNLTFDGNILNWYSPIGFSVQDGAYTSVYIVALAGVSSWSEVTSATPFAVSVNSYNFGNGMPTTFQYGFDNAQDFTHYNGYGWSADSELMRHQLVLFTTSAPTSVSEISTYAETSWQPQGWEDAPWGIQVYSAAPAYSKGLSIDKDSALDILDLATVAISGSYNDLSNKPTIPTYSAGTGISISSGTISADTTVLATKAELPDGVPAVTSSDDDKVLKASYSGGVGSYAWESEPVILGLTAGSNVTITEANNAVTIAATDTTYTAGNMIAIDANNSNAIGVSTTAGITDIQQVASLPANPVSTVLYLIPET